MTESEGNELLVVEGDWKQFQFKMLQPEDFPKMLEHLRKVYYQEETFCKLANCSEQDFNLLDQMVLHYLKENDGLGLSFYAEEKETGKLAAVRITYKHWSNESAHPPSSITPELKEYLESPGFFNTINNQGNIAEKYGIDYYADFLMLSVEPEYRKEGLATEMYRRSLLLLKAKGYPACKSIFTSPYARRAAEKLGFEELARIYFRDYKDENGSMLLADAEPDMFAAFMAFKFQ